MLLIRSLIEGLFGSLTSRVVSNKKLVHLISHFQYLFLWEKSLRTILITTILGEIIILFFFAIQWRISKFEVSRRVAIF